MNEIEYCIENINIVNKYRIPDGVTLVYNKLCNINNLILSDSIESIYLYECVIKKITLNSKIIVVRVSKCELEFIDVKNTLTDIIIMDLHDNNLKKFDIEVPDSLNELDLSYNKLYDLPIKIPYKIHLHIRGNLDIKLKHLDFIFDSNKTIRYAIGDCVKILKLRYLTKEQQEELYNRVINNNETYINLKTYESI